MAGVAVIMPALNESGNIGALVSTLTEGLGIAVVVVDDRSGDSTATVARETGALVLTLPTRLGAWGATQTGLRYALREGYEIMITMDADGQHNPYDVPSLLTYMLNNDVDLVIGSSPERGTNLRRFAWRLLRFASGLPWKDLTSGYRVLNRQAASVFTSKLASTLDYQDIGLLILSQKSGLRVREIPVSMSRRYDGKSRIFNSWWAVCSYMSKSILLSVAWRATPISRRSPSTGQGQDE